MKKLLLKYLLPASFVLANAAFTNASLAAVYQTTDENGVTVFTDKPDIYTQKGNAVTELPEPQLQIVPAFDSGHKKANAAEQENQPLKQQMKHVRYQLKIISPVHESTVRKPAESIGIAVSVSPKLQSTDKVVLKVDGETVATGTSASISTDKINRGMHQVSASIINKQGREVAQQSVNVYVHQHSKLFHKNNKKQKPASTPWYHKVTFNLFQKSE